MKEPIIDWNDSSHEGSVARKKKMMKIMSAILVVLVIGTLAYLVKKQSDKKKVQKLREEAIQSLVGDPDGAPVDMNAVHAAQKDLMQNTNTTGGAPTEAQIQNAVNSLAQ